MPEQQNVDAQTANTTTEAADRQTNQVLDSVVNGHAYNLVKKLSVSDAPFYSTGMAHIKVTKNGQEKTLKIPIRAVDLEEVETFCRNFRPKVPTKRDKIQGRWVTILDEANPEYQQDLLDYQRILSRAWCLMAMDVDVEDAAGKVVWSADNTVRELDPAVKALRAMGLVDSQFAAILRAARDLTQFAEEEEDRD